VTDAVAVMRLFASGGTDAGHNQSRS
jgi:hypothetical protein